MPLRSILVQTPVFPLARTSYRDSLRGTVQPDTEKEGKTLQRELYAFILSRLLLQWITLWSAFGTLPSGLQTTGVARETVKDRDSIH